MIPSGLDDWDEWDGDVKRDGEMIALAEAVKALFEEWYGELREEDFVAVVDLLGFEAHKKAVPGERLKPVAENYFPDIIGTNLEYAGEAYRWETHVPMTKDGRIVSGLWDREKGEGLPDGYELEVGGRFLSRKVAKTRRTRRL